MHFPAGIQLTDTLAAIPELPFVAIQMKSYQKGKIIMEKNPLKYSILIGLLVAVNLPAFAGFTPVLDGDEPGHLDILNELYGEGFVPTSDDSFENPDLGITAIRMPDYVGENPVDVGDNLLIGSPSSMMTDQIWEDGTVNALVRARFASWSQYLGYFEGTSGEEYIHIFSVEGSGFEVSGEAVVDFADSPIWRWARASPGASTVSSRAIDNDGIDYMVTYWMVGIDGAANTFLICWEDGYGDDFNDMVVEVMTSDSVRSYQHSWSGVKAMFR